MIRFPAIPKISDHGSEIGLLAALGLGVIALLWHAIDRTGADKTTLDVAAFLLVLQRIIEAITARWTQRSVDRMGQQLASSAPTPETVDKTTVEGGT